MANEAKQFTIGGVTHDVMDVGARQLIAQLQAAIDAITSGDTTTAIKTFQEVIDFLDGVTDDTTLIGKLNELRTLINAKYSKPASGIPASDLADGVIPDVSGFATKTEVNAKANTADVYTKTEVDTKVADAGKVKSVSVNGGTAQTPDGNGNVNVSVPTLTLDDAPTAGSNNAVKSGGIKTAIDQVTPTIDANGKWVIGGVATDKDAQGPRGNSILVNENAQGIQALIVNNVVDGGETDILSAEMGKVLRQNIMKIFNALGVYAFPEGKPTLNWGSTAINHSINVNGVTGGLTISDVEVDGVSVGSLPAQVVEGKSLSLRLALPSNLYVFDDGVSVKMGGVDITSTAFSEATGEVNIAEVTDDVVIIATALTYVGYGESNSPLAFMLDCKNLGNQSGHWIDLAGNIDFTLGSAVTAADSGVVFDGSLNSYGETDSLLSVAPATATVEAVVEGASGQYNPILVNPTGNAGSSVGLVICTPSNETKRAIMNLAYAGYSEPTVNTAAPTGDVNNFALSMNAQRYINKGVSIATSIKYTFVMNAAHTKLTIGKARRPDHSNDLAFVGTIKAIRVYNAVLTEAQQMQNWKVDQKRFNIS